MKHLGIFLLLLLAGCKTPTTTSAAIKEKPIADPLFTSKKAAVIVNRSATMPHEEEVAIPQPPSTVVLPPRPDINIRLAGER